MAYEYLGVFFSLLATYYFIHINRKAWIYSLIASALNCCLYWKNGIFADTFLEGFYFFSTCYGFYQWLQPAKEERKLVLFLNYKQWSLLFLITSMLYVVSFYVLILYSASKFPGLDAATVSLCLMAQLLMCYKIIYTWGLWFLADVLYILMYVQKSLPFHVLLMVVYSIMAIIGCISWLKARETFSQSRV